MRKVGLGAAVLLVVGILATPQVDAATVINVTKTTDDTQNGCTASDCSLREAILRSNATKAVETIVLGPEIYALDDFPGANEDFAVTGDLDIRRPVIITGKVLQTAISQETTDRVFHVVGNTPGALTLIGVVVTSGQAANSNGGGIQVDLGRSATLDRSIVYDNVASFGGGGIANHGTLTVRDSRITDNVATFGGGGVMNFGNAVFSGTEIENNDAGQGGAGVEIQGSRSTTFVDTTIAGNQTGTHEGGGIRAFSGEPSIRLLRTTVNNNTANTSGGGVWLSLIEDAAVNNRVVIDDSTISGNSAKSQGGGISAGVDGPPVAILQTTITSNTSDSDTNEAALTGGGIYQAQDGSVTLRASIVAGNVDTGAAAGTQDCNENLTTAGSNVVEAGCLAAPAATDAVVASATFLGALGFNGGRTRTHALTEGSAPQDRHAGAGCAGTDQRGVPRPTGGACDSGSYEYAECGNTPVNLVGTPRDDVIDGTPGADVVLGLAGNDRILGRDGNDVLCGGAGDDQLIGGIGDDRLFGQGGDDVMNGGPDADTCAGGPGTDREIDC